MATESLKTFITEATLPQNQKKPLTPRTIEALDQLGIKYSLAEIESAGIKKANGEQLKGGSEDEEKALIYSRFKQYLTNPHIKKLITSEVVDAFNKKLADKEGTKELKEAIEQQQKVERSLQYLAFIIQDCAAQKFAASPEEKAQHEIQKHWLTLRTELFNDVGSNISLPKTVGKRNDGLKKGGSEECKFLGALAGGVGEIMAASKAESLGKLLEKMRNLFNLDANYEVKNSDTKNETASKKWDQETLNGAIEVARLLAKKLNISDNVLYSRDSSIETYTAILKKIEIAVNNAGREMIEELSETIFGVYLKEHYSGKTPDLIEIFAQSLGMKKEGIKGAELNILQRIENLYKGYTERNKTFNDKDYKKNFFKSTIEPLLSEFFKTTEIGKAINEEIHKSIQDGFYYRTDDFGFAKEIANLVSRKGLEVARSERIEEKNEWPDYNVLRANSMMIAFKNESKIGNLRYFAVKNAEKVKEYLVETRGFYTFESHRDTAVKLFSALLTHGVKYQHELLVPLKYAITEAVKEEKKKEGQKSSAQEIFQSILQDAVKLADEKKALLKTRQTKALKAEGQIEKNLGNIKEQIAQMMETGYSGELLAQREEEIKELEKEQAKAKSNRTTYQAEYREVSNYKGNIELFFKTLSEGRLTRVNVGADGQELGEVDVEDIFAEIFSKVNEQNADITLEQIQETFQNITGVNPKELPKSKYKFNPETAVQAANPQQAVAAAPPMSNR